LCRSLDPGWVSAKPEDGAPPEKTELEQVAGLPGNCAAVLLVLLGRLLPEVSGPSLQVPPPPGSSPDEKLTHAQWIARVIGHR